MPRRPASLRRPRRWISAALPWSLAAAAGLLAALVALRPPRTPGPPLTDPVASIMQAPDVTRAAFEATSEGAEYATARGEVYFSPSLQRGVLSIAGLPPNDPATSQYQLWIVDPSRDSHPVDGGVFDAPSGGVATVVVEPKLPVVRPTLFAVTREKPGGVVVSSGPLLLVARTE